MPKRPNILWLMTDEQRCDSLGCYGSPWARTPHLDQLAQRGVRFETAVTPAPVCLPARAAFMTGNYPSRTDLWWNQGHHGKALPHLTHAFHAAGYRSASFGKQHYGVTNKGFATEAHHKYSKHVHPFYYEQPHDESRFDVVKYPPEPYAWIFGGRYPAPADETAEATAVRGAMAWLDEHLASHADEPFLLRVSFNSPHTPVSVPEPFDRCIDAGAIDLPAEAESMPAGAPRWVAESLAAAAKSLRLTAEQIARMRPYYYGLASFVDAQFGVMLDALRDRNLLDDTIVAFVSDHGTHLGDFGLVQKQTFYEPVVNVPFVLAGPGVAEGAVCTTAVEAMSLLPTLAALCDVELDQACDAVSFAEAVAGGVEPAARPVFSEFTLGSFDIRPNDRLVMVREGDWKLSLCMDPHPCEGQLHNLADDPHERRNLFEDEAHASVRTRLTERIEAHLSGTDESPRRA